MFLRTPISSDCARRGAAAVLALIFVAPTKAQGPTPETGNTLFPGGAFIAYKSTFTAHRAPEPATPRAALRPTFKHEGEIIFTWGFRRDFELTAALPLATHDFHFAGSASSRVGGTGLGDASVTLKYRFLRLDSDRGTSQASVVFGPKLPTGRTGLRDASAALLPPGLQTGTGSTGLLLGANATYTGLFNIEKLVADGAFHYTLRTQGSQQIRLGNTSEARLWLSYRPYQTHSVEREWFIGPALTWTHSARDAQSGVSVLGSAGDTLLLGAATYFSPKPGLHLWLAADFPVAQTRNGIFGEERHRISFGVTKQFRIAR